MMNIMRIALAELREGERDRYSHITTILQIQQSFLVSLMEVSPLPATLMGREKWLQRHIEDICTVLSPFKCYCSYPQSLNGIRVDDYQWSRTPGDFICLLLAELHRTTPAQIRKLLSHRQSRRKTL
jgi:hypothetical protein